MHDRLQSMKRKLLGKLYIKMGSVIAAGGAEFDEEGNGFFIPEPGEDVKAIPTGGSAVIETAAGEVIRVRDVGVEPSTSTLPRRYTFTHFRQPRRTSA